MLKNKAMMISGLGLGLLGLGGVASADEVSIQNYTVVAGDTVSNIATKFNSTVSEIDSLNNFKDVNMIFVGEVIKVPSNTLKTNNTTYQTTKPVSVQQSQTQINTNQSNNHDMGYSVKPQATEYPQQTKPVQSSGGGSVKQRFLAAGGTEDLWNTIVLPESGGNPNAVSPNGYRGLGQTKESWATGSVEQQTKGMVDYCNRRYGGISQAIAFRQANGWY